MRRSRGGSAPARRAAAGVSLIEVLVAVLLLAVGGLAMAMAHASALRRTHGAQMSTTAVLASASLSDAMRANRTAMLDGNYDTAGELCAAQPVPGGNLAQQDLRRWLEALSAGMGTQAAVCGSVSCQKESCELVVQWDDSRAAGREGETRARMVLGIAP